METYDLKPENLIPGVGIRKYRDTIRRPRWQNDISASVKSQMDKRLSFLYRYNGVLAALAFVGTVLGLEKLIK